MAKKGNDANVATHLDLGMRGEAIAARHLRRLGYRIVGSRVRVGRDEIDLIAYDDAEKMHVFVEVKTRTHAHDQYPIAGAVDRKKRRCVRRAIARWCIEQKMDGPARLDVICVVRDVVQAHWKGLDDPFSS